MFSELTLALHVLLLGAIYLFLLATVWVILKDLSAAKGAADERVPRLIAFAGEDQEEDYPIIDGLLIGRAPDCDVVLEDTFASAHHARVYLASSNCWLEDLKSTNGTFVNDKRIDVPVRLSRGSKFKIGRSEFQFMD